MRITLLTRWLSIFTAVLAFLFIYYQTTHAQQKLYLVTGKVYEDTNRNGIQDPNEAPIPDTAVKLRGATKQETVTNENGQYVFSINNPGEYSVSVIDPNTNTPLFKVVRLTDKLYHATANFSIKSGGITIQSETYQCGTLSYELCFQNDDVCYWDGYSSQSCMPRKSTGASCNPANQRECLSGICNSNGTCGGSSACGGAGEPCCPGFACTGNQTCGNNNFCIACGLAGQPCCEFGASCRMSGLSCNSSNICSAPKVAPTAQIFSPVNGQTVSDIVIITVNINKGSASSVILDIYGGSTPITQQVVGGTTAQFSWNTKTVPNGQYRLTTRVTDAADGTSGTTNFNGPMITVNNVPPISTGPQMTTANVVCQANPTTPWKLQFGWTDASPPQSIQQRGVRIRIPSVSNTWQKYLLPANSPQEFGGAGTGTVQVAVGAKGALNTGGNSSQFGETNDGWYWSSVREVPINCEALTAAPTITNATATCTPQTPSTPYRINVTWTKGTPSNFVKEQYWRVKNPGSNTWGQKAPVGLNATTVEFGGAIEGQLQVVVGNKGSVSTGGNSSQFGEANDGIWWSQPRTVTVACISPTKTPTLTPTRIPTQVPNTPTSVPTAIPTIPNTPTTVVNPTVPPTAVPSGTQSTPTVVHSTPTTRPGTSHTPVPTCIGNPTLCGSITYPPLSSSTPTIPASTCGNLACDNGETPQSCPQDCDQVACGDNICSAGENVNTCAQDCPVTCGDNICSPSETPFSCAADCDDGTVSPTPRPSGSNATATPRPSITGAVTSQPTTGVSVSPNPSATATVTPTIGPNLIKLLMKIPGIGNLVGDNKTPQNPNQSIAIGLKKSDNNNALPAVRQLNFANGLFGTDVQVTVPTGTYTIYVLSNNSLVKKVPGTYQLGTGSTISVPQFELVTGDFNRDNKLDALDYNQLLACFNKPFSTSCRPTDLNDDGKVEEKDVNIFLRALPTRTGDTIQ